MNIKYYLLLTIFCLPVSLTSLAGSENKELQTRLIKLSQQLEAKRLQHNIPGMAIAIVKDDKVIFSKGYGVSNLDKQTQVTSKTLFGIGSTTKAFTSTLVGILVDQGKMNWDDPVTKYLPDLKFSPKNTVKEITIRDMLSHRTGYTRFNMLYANGKRTRQEVLSDATNAKPWEDFRHKFVYNNVMYTGAGVASAKSVDSDWDSLLEKILLKPLGMSSTTSLLEQAFK